MIGEDGEVITYVGGKLKKEALKPAPVMIRNAREVAGFVPACGMKRQVYKRVGDAKWVAMNAPPAAATEKAGFEAIDGFSETDLSSRKGAGGIPAPSESAHYQMQDGMPESVEKAESAPSGTTPSAVTPVATPFHMAEEAER
uniref:Uncharacterized protein n=1 Tax=Myxococcus fulvus TaxID=33 RepID=A0A3Q8I2E1_MYXFU|nr:hypothetical protein [Myxococcus fulvus]